MGMTEMILSNILLDKRFTLKIRYVFSLRKSYRNLKNITFKTGNKLF